MLRYIILLSICVNTFAQTYETGKIIDSILVSDKNKETFAMYLPSAFDANVASPIVFVFDPGAEGKRGIQQFVKASESYGYILVCSNHTKNGPYDRNFDITNRLFEFMFANFRIKQDQIYLSGFSGGSRLASAIAVLTNQVAGVVGCGAGFSQESSHIPSTQNFAYVGVCGDRDMNYQEMIRAKGYLQKLNFTNTLITYDGNHSWTPPDQILRAFDWLEIQAHLREVRKKEASEIYKSYKKVYNTGLEAEKESDLIIAVENYERALTTYNSFYNLDSIVNKLKIIHKSKAYKNLLKSVSKAFDKEVALTKKFTTRLFEDYKKPNKIDLSWWEQELGKLEKLDKKEDIQTKKMLERLRFQIFAVAYSMNNPNLYESNEKQKKLADKIRKLIYP
ncbi:hypothetical protein SAMN04487910_3264 [Aquimarina amphilecti]|uniref:Phospholipase/carboxylesterase/thioesterase domain-containing protein n=1 Tax=Aquimarina amphilecti TaxID=1038014 RepID=A0A1H7T306_AQUAM|nr:hypothetical protein [Aquimarina amphilecti]SEL79098.1 hypothetical protein SAMN04487910_3264 [Aquimarina amphilecti]